MSGTKSSVSPSFMKTDPGYASNRSQIDAALHVMGLSPDELEAESHGTYAADHSLTQPVSTMTLVPRGIARLRAAITSRRLRGY